MGELTRCVGPPDRVWVLGTSSETAQRCDENALRVLLARTCQTQPPPGLPSRSTGLSHFPAQDSGRSVQGAVANCRPSP